MRRPVSVLTIIVVVMGLAMMSSALVLAANDSPAPLTSIQQEMPDATGAALLDYILHENPYTEWGSWNADRWNDYADFLVSGAPHGETVRIFVNDVALEAVNSGMFDGSLPNGSIVVKENYGGSVDMPGDVAALTVMYKVEGYNPDGGDWFYVKASADGMTIDAEGLPDGCVNCHAGGAMYDYQLRYGFGSEPVTTYGDPLPEATGAALAEYIFNTNPYTEWGSWPEQNMDDFSGPLVGNEPHGATVQIFVNERGLRALDRAMPMGYPYGTIIVKANHMGTPDDPGDPAALTVMYKVEGFNPDGGDWFYLSVAGDNSAINTEGLPDGCVSCHAGAADQDYVFRFNYHQYHDEMMSGDMGGDMMVDGDAIIETSCTACHTRERIDNAEKDAAGWTDTVDRMIGYGVTLTDQERADLIAYLASK